MKYAVTLFALSLIVPALAPTARAGLILQPTAASSGMGTFPGTSPDNTRNQSGLSAGYTSMVTEFDAYLASNPTHDSSLFSFSNIWVSADNTTTGNFDFDLGGTFAIQSFALWNSTGNISVNGFDLLADDNPAFSSPAFLGSFNAATDTGPAAAVLPEVFGFSSTTASFVRMVVTSNYANPTNTMFGEAAFEAASVPEPATLTLLAMGSVAGLAGAAWRRRKGIA